MRYGAASKDRFQRAWGFRSHVRANIRSPYKLTVAETFISAASSALPAFSTRKVVHISMVLFAFLLPLLTWRQAAGCALLALLFNTVILPRFGLDLRKTVAGKPSADVWTGIVIYPLSILALILLYRHSLYVVGATWAILALGDGAAGVVGGAWRRPVLPWNRGKTWAGFLAFFVAATFGAYVLIRWVAPAFAPEIALRIGAAAALVGAIVESLPIRLDDNATIPLVCGAFIFCLGMVERSALDSNWPYLGRRVLLAAAVNLILALLALSLKMVTPSGAIAGFLLGVAAYLGWGYKSFLIMFAFFAIGSLATRLGYARKAARGIAEKRGGARSWREAVANSVAGAFFSLLVITTHHEGAFLIALVAAFAEAAGDTASSEIGQWLSGRAYLITTFQAVPAGENGGVSLGGSVAGIFASSFIAALAIALGLFGKGGASVALSAAVAGNLLDSILGATIERRGLVTNGIVNFTGTSFAGLLALAIALRVGY